MAVAAEMAVHALMRLGCHQVQGPLLLLHGAPLSVLQQVSTHMVDGQQQRRGTRAVWSNGRHLGGGVEYTSSDTHLDIQLSENSCRRAVLEMITALCRTPSALAVLDATLSRTCCAVRGDIPRNRHIIKLWGAERLLMTIQKAIAALAEKWPNNVLFLVLWPRLRGIHPGFKGACWSINCARHDAVKPIQLSPQLRHLAQDVCSALSTAGPFLNTSVDTLARSCTGLPLRSLCTALLQVVRDDCTRHRVVEWCARADTERCHSFSTSSNSYQHLFLDLAMNLRGDNSPQLAVGGSRRGSGHRAHFLSGHAMPAGPHN
jgi:hypothetical protein